MFQLNSAALMLRLEHRHSDGSWATFEPEPGPHDPANRDPERAWATGQIYVCSVCDEQIRVTGVTDEAGQPRP